MPQNSTDGFERRLCLLRFALAILSAIAIYRHATTGPWDYFGKNRGLVFHRWLKDIWYTQERIPPFYAPRDFLRIFSVVKSRKASDQKRS